MDKNVRTIKWGTLGDHKLRLVQKGGHFYGMVDGRKCVDGSDPDDVWRRLHDDAGKADPKYVGYAGVRKRFLEFFPDGFGSDRFSSCERDHKLKARKKLADTAPLPEAMSGSGLGEAVLSVFQATNMLSPYEKPRVSNMLRGPDADAFVRAAAMFADDVSAPALYRLEQVLRRHDCAKWTVATYLPFLWRPEVNMFLKPEATKDFAVCVGHPFSWTYRPDLDFDVYLSLLDLADNTIIEIADLDPQDHIDTQSFIWVVNKYPDDSRSVS